jgi:hypothetical protein
MKKNIFVATGVLILILFACKQKKTEDKNESFFPVLSFLQSQVADIDTSLYSIMKIVYIDSLHSDTSWVNREEFRGLAKDFLAIPDIASKKYKKLYAEEKLYDESMNRVILSYIPIKSDKAEIQKQEILITPDVAIGDKVSSIIIDLVVSNKDGSLQKKMLWRVDQSFQVTTISQKPGEPEIISTLKVTWNEPDEK